MRRAEMVTAGLMAALSIYLMWKSAELPIGWIPDEGPGGGAFSFWLAAIMLGCCGWIMINWARRTSPPSRSSEPYMPAAACKMFLLVGGAGTALIALVPAEGAPEVAGGNMDHFCLRIEPFDETELRAHLASHGVEVGEVARRYGAEGDGPSLYLQDPDGNTVELKGPPDG